MKKYTLHPSILILALFLLMACSGSKGLQKDLEQTQHIQARSDSTLKSLDTRLKEFAVEVHAMRDTYDEDHKTLEDLYRLNSESRKGMEEMNQKMGTRVEEMSQTLQAEDSTRQAREVALDSTLGAMRGSISEMQEAVAQTQFQLDSIATLLDPEHMKTLEENLLSVQGQFQDLDSSVANLQMNVNDQLMGSDGRFQKLERHARVQDSANVDILSQLVLLENKIISLTNAFNELMAMPPQEVSRPAAQAPVETGVVPGPANSQSKLDPEVYKQHYIDALSSYQNKAYMAAIDQFQMLLRNDTSHDLADNAQYWIGECYYGLEDYPKAIEEFRKVFNFKDGNKADAAQFKVGYSYLQMGDQDHGYSELQQLVDRFPDSPYVDKARQILASR